eukprot:CAMPEP_0179114052 /NCGR_PEP_ID=MMETSP0796-20121207/53387_1 /TAXON_ID=73915 /ORGANISM="Pyrodinium bahamense, Strain pbaha01" /LENGTH=453 /DNA_ID=CAMNT_0020812263 /DNA_START=328 /DNA_END=1685 /DNA_ORIENTATION=+
MVRNCHEVLACSVCLTFVGSLEQHVDLVAGLTSPADAGREAPSWSLPSAANASKAKDLTEGPVKCPCGATFCSLRCLHDSAHEYLCVADLPEHEAEAAPLFRFKAHALKTNELYLFGGKALAHVASKLEVARDDHLGPLFPLLSMVGEPWWCFALPENGECAEQSAHEYQAKLKEETLESLGLLKSALIEGPSKHGVSMLLKLGLLDPDFWGRLLGSFQVNNFGIVCDSPLKVYLEAIAKQLHREERCRQKRPRLAYPSVSEAQQAVSVFARKFTSGAASSSVQSGAGATCASESGHIASRTCEVSLEDGKVSLQDREPIKPDSDTELSALDMLSAEDKYCPPLDGIGIFPLLASVNHSCKPNAKVSFAADTKGVRAVLVAVQHIAAGEEILHAYVDRHLPVAARVRKLREVYGFECQCARCARFVAQQRHSGKCLQKHETPWVGESPPPQSG